MMKILFIGDVVGKPGRKTLTQALPELKQELTPDITLANAENIAHGLGVTQKTLEECKQAGVDFFTSGNHIWKKPAIHEIFQDPDAPIIRPANYSDDLPGQGHKTVIVGTKQLLVLNLNGQVFINGDFSNPFHKVDELLKQYQLGDFAGVLLDFHAEVTSEKVAMGWHLDGRVSVVLGTHTHVPTADERILPGGTAYITDVGMTGLRDSVIGIDKEVILNNFIESERKSHEIAEHGPCMLNAVLVEIDPATRRAVSIKRIHKELTI